MTRRAVTSWATAAVLALNVAPAWARQSKERPESRPSNGNNTGTAVSRPSGGGSGGSSGSASSGSSSSSGGSRSSMPSGGGSSADRSERIGPRAPERRSDDRAVSRADQGRSSTAGRASSSAPVTADAAGDQRRAVPAYSRPRDGRTPVGEAVSRRFPPPVRGNSGNIYYPYYDPFYGYSSRYGYYGYYGPWFSGYGYGLGYFYDPWGYNYYSPYDMGYGYSGYGYGRSRGEYYGRGRDVGQLRLKVKPENGQVYVDGYYVGDVDSFDGVFQRLTIEAGAHRVEIRAAGFQTVTFDVMVTPGETVTYKGEMKRIR